VNTLAEKIIIVNEKAAAVSFTIEVSIIFRNGVQLTKPNSLTMCIVKRNGELKIAHYHG
jgi:hypothetical protein